MNREGGECHPGQHNQRPERGTRSPDALALGPRRQDPAGAQFPELAHGLHACRGTRDRAVQEPDRPHGTTGYDPGRSILKRVRASMKNAVILLSGGVDVTTTLVISNAEGLTSYAPSSREEQRHGVEFESAKRVAEAMGGGRRARDRRHRSSQVPHPWRPCARVSRSPMFSGSPAWVLGCPWCFNRVQGPRSQDPWPLLAAPVATCDTSTIHTLIALPANQKRIQS